MKIEDLDQNLQQLNVSSPKRIETIKNTKLSKILSFLFTNFEPNKLHLIISQKIPKEINTEENLKIIGNLIKKNIVKHEKMLIACFDYLKEKKEIDNIENYLKQFIKTDDEIEKLIFGLEINKMNKKEAYKFINNDNILKFCNSTQINNLIEKICIEKTIKDEKKMKKDEKKDEKNDEKNDEKKDDKNVEIIDEYAWLKEGELSKIHTPKTNPLNTPEILKKHLEKTNSKVITRFPPEPNGFLHIGHAKALNLSYQFSKMDNGLFILRFDDTNPKNEKEEFYESIKKDVEWILNARIEKVTYASDYFQNFIDFAFFLIKKNKAYVCNQSQEDIKKFREENLDSPFRERCIETNLILFQEMIDGKWKEGTISLRLKMDMKNKNPLMHDLIAYRVIEKEHFRTKNKFKVYPSYDFTHCINDSLEDITHSFCSREFYLRKETYCWLLDELNLYKPVQWEFSRLNIEDTVLSKRKIIELIEKKIVYGWNDPRIYTLCGLRRRGYTAEGINNFVKSVGITFSESCIEKKALENFVREDLVKKAKKINCVVDPLKIKIKDKGIFYIEKSDFKEEINKDFLRLTKDQPVGLFDFITIKFIKNENDCVFVEESNEKPKKYIHWVKENEFKEVELRIFSDLFIEGKFNENSLQIKKGFCEKEILNCNVGDNLQFRRIGFFCVDEDSKGENLVLNLTMPLKNATWK